MTDQGTEFLNRHFRALMKEDIKLYNTYGEAKASIVERPIRTLKTKMWCYFTAKKHIKIRILLLCYVLRCRICSVLLL